MADHEVWLVLYQALLSSECGGVYMAAEAADEALIQYKERWGSDADTAKS